MVGLWKDIFWQQTMKDGNGLRHIGITAEEYSESVRDDEREHSFYYTQEYFAQNKIIAEKLLKAHNISLPFGLRGEYSCIMIE